MYRGLLWLTISAGVLSVSTAESLRVELKESLNNAGLYAEVAGVVYEDQLSTCRDLKLDMSLFSNGEVRN